MAGEVLAELTEAKEGLIFWPWIGRSLLEVRGRDRKTWLQGLVTCDLNKLDVGQAGYGLAVAQKGKILADFIALVERERILLAVPDSAADALRAAFEHYLIMEDAEVEPSSGQVIIAQGARPLDTATFARQGVAHGALSWTGSAGAMLVAPTTLPTETLANMAGARVGTSGGWDAFCLERGLPRFGVDFDTSNYPQEAGLEKTAVSFDKGCYLGQEVVCMLEMRGHVKRKLVRLALDDAAVPARGAEVLSTDGTPVGSTTSGAISPYTGRAQVFAMVKVAQTEPGTALQVSGVNARVLAGGRSA